MSQTDQQERGAAPTKPGVRRYGELFWRTIAGLMMTIIGWSAWVLYQIAPRSVVTPLVNASQVKRSGTQQSEAGAAAAAASLQPAPEATAAALLMDQAQAALRSGAHQSSADVQATTSETRIEPVQGERLKLSTEITTPLVERKSIPQQQEAGPKGASPVPSATDQAGKVRP